MYYCFVETSATGADRALVWVAASEEGATLYANLTSTSHPPVPSTHHKQTSKVLTSSDSLAQHICSSLILR